MYDKCVICNRGFERGGVLKDVAAGRRVAYDPVRGRLWAVCSACKRWSLAPIESRWEALERLERTVRDEARLLAETANVSLLRAGRMEIVRIGRTSLTEESWWRYGRELRARRDRYKKLTTAGTLGAAVAIGGSVTTGGFSFLAAWLLWDHLPETVAGAARWLRFGTTAWRGRGRCARCGGAVDSLRYDERKHMILQAADGQMRLSLPCPRCGDPGRQGRVGGGMPDGGFLLDERASAGALGRVLAYHHFAGASGRRLEAASKLVEVVGGPEQLASKILPEHMRFGQIGQTGKLALEIAVHEARERRLLEMELAELEAHWRKEEALAEIMDGELTPLPARSLPRHELRGSVP